MGILTGVDKRPKTAIVDKGYQGVEVPGVRILRSGQKRGITKTLRAMIKRRSAVEPTIGHMKMDGRLARNPLKGALGDAIHAVMCGAGHNLRLILAALLLFCARMGGDDSGGHRAIGRPAALSGGGLCLKTELFRADYIVAIFVARLATWPASPLIVRWSHCGIISRVGR